MCSNLIITRPKRYAIWSPALKFNSVQKYLIGMFIKHVMIIGYVMINKNSRIWGIIFTLREIHRKPCSFVENFASTQYFSIINEKYNWFAIRWIFKLCNLKLQQNCTYQFLPMLTNVLTNATFSLFLSIMMIY